MDIKKDIQGRNMFLATRSVEAASISIGKKSDRLATALYLVTSFLSDTEPMKARLRTLSLELVSGAANVRYGSVRDTEARVLENIRANISETLSLLELSFIAGIISEMNFSILKREYTALRDKIEIKRTSRESHTDTILGESFFGSSFAEESREESRGATPRVERPVFEKDYTQKATHVSKGHSDSSAQEILKTTQSAASETKEKISTTEKKLLAPEARSQPQVFDVARESRRTRVLKLIKDKREVTIKDITNHFPELSEKTIQRELIALVESGILKKTGERRWSRYAIA